MFWNLWTSKQLRGYHFNNSPESRESWRAGILRPPTTRGGIRISGKLDGDLIEAQGGGHDFVTALERVAVIAERAVLVQGIVEFIEDDDSSPGNQPVQSGQAEECRRIEVAVIVNDDLRGRRIVGDKIRKRVLK